LQRASAQCITARREGPVLKEEDDRYFDFNTSQQHYAWCPIKLKQEYIGNFDNIGDVAVVGARFDVVGREGMLTFMTGGCWRA
jgi:hypothetical protein